MKRSRRSSEIKQKREQKSPLLLRTEFKNQKDIFSVVFSMSSKQTFEKDDLKTALSHSSQKSEETVTTYKFETEGGKKSIFFKIPFLCQI